MSWFHVLSFLKLYIVFHTSRIRDCLVFRLSVFHSDNCAFVTIANKTTQFGTHQTYDSELRWHQTSSHIWLKEQADKALWQDTLFSNLIQNITVWRNSTYINEKYFNPRLGKEPPNIVLVGCHFYCARLSSLHLIRFYHIFLESNDGFTYSINIS